MKRGKTKKRGKKFPSWLKWLIVFFIVVILVLVTVMIIKSQYITAKECASQGGVIVNTLGGADCKSPDAFLGNIPGMKCPCICCKE